MTGPQQHVVEGQGFGELGKIVHCQLRWRERGGQIAFGPATVSWRVLIAFLAIVSNCAKAMMKFFSVWCPMTDRILGIAREMPERNAGYDVAIVGLGAAGASLAPSLRAGASRPR